MFTTDERGNVSGGFDVVVGNPPFAGRETLSASSHIEYIDWLKMKHEGSHGNSDLVAHFFRHTFDLLRPFGCFGLIATNTIGQGDTRSTGLRWICEHGGTIYRAIKRLKWPGEAAVVVSVVHISKGDLPRPYFLNGRKTDKITAFLFHAGGNEDPARLKDSTGKSFQGCVVVGMGFTFDDDDQNGIASPLAEMRRLINADPRNQDVILPYIGGEEVNTSPTQAFRRYVISFGQRTEQECRQLWPDLLRIVEEKVLPERRDSLTKSRSQDKEKRLLYWWQFSRFAKDLYEDRSKAKIESW